MTCHFSRILTLYSISYAVFPPKFFVPGPFPPLCGSAGVVTATQLRSILSSVSHLFSSNLRSVRQPRMLSCENRVLVQFNKNY